MASSRLERIGTIFTRAEGLLKRGAIKPDDRPVWFDVYKAFPPLVEPLFARPKPEPKPLRPILYQEDVIRQQFHSKGYGLSAVNMLSPEGETHTKKLIKKYQQLESEGVPQSELVEKSVAAVDSERKMYKEESTYQSRPTPNPDSITAKVLSEDDIKNIFNDNK